MKKLLFIVFFLYVIFSVSANIHRIIGGTTAYAAQYPFMAAIYKTTSDGQYFCGGTLINQRWILTAGQCVDGAVLFTIYLGTSNIKTPSETAVKLATDEYVLHPDFNPMTLENDIGFIKLRMDVTYSTYINRALLSNSDISPSTNLGTIYATGWGQTSDESAELADELNYVIVSVLENDECKLTYGSQITNEMVCVAGNYNQGTCHGDTGTPLVLTYKFTHTQYGIASFVSANGCESTDPSGYTRIYPYRTWITNVTGV